MVADCITPDPDKRPDVTQVLAVATAMHSKYGKDDNVNHDKPARHISPVLTSSSGQDSAALLCSELLVLLAGQPLLPPLLPLHHG